MLTFIIKSGLYVPTPAIPIPDLAVPYAAPRPIANLALFVPHSLLKVILLTSKNHLGGSSLASVRREKTDIVHTAKAIPACQTVSIKIIPQ